MAIGTTVWFVEAGDAGLLRIESVARSGELRHLNRKPSLALRTVIQGSGVAGRSLFSTEGERLTNDGETMTLRVDPALRHSRDDPGEFDVSLLAIFT